MKRSSLLSRTLMGAIAVLFAGIVLADEKPADAEVAAKAADLAGTKVTAKTPDDMINDINSNLAGAVEDQQNRLLEDVKDCFKQTKGQVDPLSALSIQAAGDANLASVELLSAYTPLSRNVGRWFVPKTLAVRLTTTLPATTGELSEYGDTQLLLREGGLFNAYFSFGGSPAWFRGGCGEQSGAFEAKLTNEVLGDYIRPYSTDKLYLHVHPLPAIARWYMTHGVGIKGIRTGLSDDEVTGEKADELSAAGAAYLGFGLDGPVHNFFDGQQGHAPAGQWDMQATVSALRINNGDLRKIYGDDVDEDWLFAFGARYKITLTKSISIFLDYNGPIGQARDFMDDVTVFSISYSPDYAQRMGLKQPDAAEEAGSEIKDDAPESTEAPVITDEPVVDGAPVDGQAPVPEGAVDQPEGVAEPKGAVVEGAAIDPLSQAEADVAAAHRRLDTVREQQLYWAKIRLRHAKREVEDAAEAYERLGGYPGDDEYSDEEE